RMFFPLLFPDILVSIQSIVYLSLQWSPPAHIYPSLKHLKHLKIRFPDVSEYLVPDAFILHSDFPSLGTLCVVFECAIESVIDSSMKDALIQCYRGEKNDRHPN